MSQGDASTSAYTGRKLSDQYDINLLYKIVLRAQDDPLSVESPKQALLSAYRIVFAENDLDTLGDNRCFSLLLKIVAPETPDGDLFAKFEHVLKHEGIELSFDDDTRSASTTNSASSIPQEDTAPSPIDDALQDGDVVDNATPGQASEPLAIMSSYSTDAGAIDYDAYMDNTPPHITRLMQIAEAMDRRTLLRQGLSILNTRNIDIMDRQADNYYHRNLLLRALTQWRNVVVDGHADLMEAESVYKKNLRSRSLMKLINIARVQRIQAMEEERLKGQAMYKMTLATREAQFSRRMDMKLKQRFLFGLVDSFRADQAQQAQLAAILQQRRLKTDAQIIHPAVNKLVQRSRQLGMMSHIANHHYETRLSKDTIQMWNKRAQGLKAHALMAHDLREYFLIRKYLYKLREVAHAKRERRTVLGKWTLARWRNLIDVKKHETYDKNYKSVRRLIKMNLARRHMRTLLKEAVRVREMEKTAKEYSEARTKVIAHNAIIQIYNKSMQVKDLEQTAITNSDRLALKHTMAAITQRTGSIQQMKEVATRYQRLHVQRTAVNCLKHISMRSFEVQRREQDADAFRGRQDKKVLRSLLEKMRNAASQSRGEEPLRLPPATPSQRRAEELNRLTSTTPLYTPATRSLGFAARLRGEGFAGARRTAGRIAEEAEGEDEAREGVNVGDGNIDLA